jgi:class 3 adenylate cyclase
VNQWLGPWRASGEGVVPYDLAKSMVITDLHGFGARAEASPMTVVEPMLDRLLAMVSGVCQACGGTNRVGEADAYCVTFPDPDLTLAAVERLAQESGAFERDEGFP